MRVASWASSFCSCCSIVIASLTASAARAEDRFFLLLAEVPPETELVQAAHRESQRSGPPVAPVVAKDRLGRAFPRLFASGRTIDASALEADLKASRAAHFAGQYQDAEATFAKALEAAESEPELLGDKKLFQRLVDGAAVRFKNTVARKRPKNEAKTQLQGFLARYPLAAPTASDHAPEVLTAWADARKAASASMGSIVVNVHPLDLERGGSCRLLLNGAEVADLPQPGPLGVPRGDHVVQVRCGPQVSWLQRVRVDAAPVTLRVPVRAMLSARGDATTGGVVLVAPSDGDAAALVQAVSAAASFSGAVVAVAGTLKVKFGRWETASDAPTLETVGRLEDGGIANVRPIAAGESGGGGGRVWTWVVGGIGLATLGGAVVTNVIAADKINAGDTDYQGIKTTSIALYIAGGALLATSVVLFFVEGASGDEGGDDDTGGVRAGPGGLVVTF